jgi:hypothetical protein
MKKGGPDINISDVNKNNIIKLTLDHLSEEDHKALEACHKEVDEIFLSHYEVTRQGLVRKDALCEVTPEVWSNPSLSLNNFQAMINEMMHRLIEERDEKRSFDSNIHASSSSSCIDNFVQTNPQPSGTSADAYHNKTHQPSR